MSSEETPADRSIIRRLHRRLGPGVSVYVGVLAAIVFIFTVGLEAVRLWGLEQSIGFGTAAELLRSEIFVFVAFAAAAVGIGLSNLGRWVRRLGLLSMHGIAVFIVFANVVAHYFLQATGSPLNWPVFNHGIGYLRESPDVVLSEAPAIGWVFLALGLFVVIAVPPLAARFADSRADEAESDVAPPSRWAGVGWLATGCVSLMVAAIPATWLDYDVGVSRNASIHLVATAFSAPTAEAPDKEPRFDISDVRLEQIDEPEVEHVAVIILESVRASATTIHNPDLETTPLLAELADDSLVFDQAYATVPHTSKALVAMLCGVEPRIVMDIVESEPGGHPGRCLPALLGDEGYESLFMQSATEQFEARRGLVANMGYDEFIPLEQMDPTGYEEANYFGYEDDIMLPYSREWLEEGDDIPRLATYLTITPHHDYRAPRTYGRFHFTPGDVFNRYLNSVRYIDHFVDNLIEQYRQLGLYDSTLFVIAGDHGEAFGEHGREQHDNVPWQEGIHIPFLIHDGSGTLDTGRTDAPISHIDLVPTVLELLGYEPVGAEYPGYRAGEVEPDRAVHFSCWFDNQCAGFVQHGHKYIHHYGNRPDELFNLVDDPLEQENLLEDGASDGEAIEQIREWKQSVDAAYEKHRREVINRRVLASLPTLEHTGEEHVGDAVQILGWEWTDDGELRVAFRVLRDFRMRDEAEFVGGGDAEAQRVAVPMRGVWPALFWQQGQVLVDEISRETVDEAGELWLEVGDDRAEVVSVD